MITSSLWLIFDLIHVGDNLLSILFGTYICNIQRSSEPQIKNTKAVQSKDEEEEGLEEEDEEEHGETLCGACGENYASDEFWICCDICEKWFHGKCVKITPARAEHIKQYKCPSCSNKRIRPWCGLHRASVVFTSNNFRSLPKPKLNKKRG